VQHSVTVEHQHFISVHTDKTGSIEVKTTSFITDVASMVKWLRSLTSNKLLLTNMVSNLARDFVVSVADISFLPQNYISWKLFECSQSLGG
jgi:hypothetical protein